MNTLAAWLHTLSPFAIRFTETFGLRWYGLSYLAGFLIGWLILGALARRRLALIPAAKVGDAMMLVVLGTVVGGRVGYALIYDRALWTTFTSDPPWWGLLAINQGGMASHGGLVGLVIASWTIARGWRNPDPAGPPRLGACPVLHVMDLLALVAPAGLFLGRLANFVNGELLGQIVSPPGTPGPWWTVQFPQELRGWAGPMMRDPRSHAPDLAPGQEQQLWALVDSLRSPGDSWPRGIEKLISRAGEYPQVLAPLLSSRHPSQLYQALAEGLLLGALLWGVWARARRPGVVAAWFFIGYGLLRIATEVWRLPDAQFGADGRPWGLSRGQWLSAAMVMVGVGLLAWAVRSGRDRIGGWRKPASPLNPVLSSPARRD